MPLEDSTTPPLARRTQYTEAEIVNTEREHGAQSRLNPLTQAQLEVL
jgi:hypothetical protein